MAPSRGLALGCYVSVCRFGKEGKPQQTCSSVSALHLLVFCRLAFGIFCRQPFFSPTSLPQGHCGGRRGLLLQPVGAPAVPLILQWVSSHVDHFPLVYPSVLQEPCNKRVRPLGRVTSLANLISPVRNGAVRRFGQTIQSISFRGDGKSPGMANKPCSKAAVPTPPKRRNSTLWSETLDVHQKGTFSTKEIKRQEAIFELSRGEQDLIEDLQLARKAYHDPMLKLSIMSEEELNHIFGDLDAYIPLHEDLLAQLAKATGPDGTVGQIGHIVVRWLPGLNAYRDYCSHQLAAKALLDQKKQDRRVQDFLQRCLESPFSRKLDLWSFLDVPRSRLVKYPLLLKEILRHTPPEHPDTPALEQAIGIIQAVLSDINAKKGESECQYYMDKLEYLDERQKDPRLELCRTLLCHGDLRSKGGTKLHVFLFTELLVLTRPVMRGERQCFQVYRQPIPVQDLVLEDLQDGDVRMGGSFRGAFGNTEKGLCDIVVLYRSRPAVFIFLLQHTFPVCLFVAEVQLLFLERVTF
uniref:Neuroepithelial cell transforming 1 n=1 Tax=Scleropages formosus TaxID=113540 RepID=A0A8C9W7H2_SCLFO